MRSRKRGNARIRRERDDERRGGRERGIGRILEKHIKKKRKLKD